MPAKIIFTCGREPEYPRNSLIRHALGKYFELTEVTDHSRWVFFRYFRLIIKLFIATRSEHDLVFIGFHGYVLALITKLLTRKPIILDAFTSVYDTFCFDRKTFPPDSIFGKFAFWLDKKSADLSDIVCLDTQAQAQYYHNTFNIRKNKLEVFFVGCDETIFFPRPSNSTEPTVIFYGNYLPLQGVSNIVKAAKLLENNKNLKIKLLGWGQDYKYARNLVKDLGLTNIEFFQPIPYLDLPEFINQGIICLGGHFGQSEKASRVIAGKTFQCLAMGKPTIVGENSANHELLTHGYDAWFCPMNNPSELAKAIEVLISDEKLRIKLGENAAKTINSKATFWVLSDQIQQLVNHVLSH